LLVVLAAVSSAVVGCGGNASGDEDQTYSVVADTTMTTASIAKAQYIPQVNKICRQAWAIIHHNFKEYSGWHETKHPTEAVKKKRFVNAVRLSLLAGIDFHIFDGIYRLGAPKGEERRLEEIIGPLQSAVERGQKNLAPISSVAKLATLFGEYNKRARQYGFADCLVDEPHLQPIEA
jgi:hypothetical protein